MKKIMLRFSIILVCLIGFLNAQELIVNGGFEEWSGSVPAGWIKESEVNLIQANSPVFEGIYSVGLQATSTTNAGIYHDVNITPGDSYTFKVSLYALGVGTQGVGFLISWYDSSDRFLRSDGPKYSTVSNQWVLDSIVSTPPSNAYYARLRIRCYADNALGGYADKASFYKSSSPPQGTPPNFASIFRVPEYPQPGQSFNIIALLSDPDYDIESCSLFYSINFGNWIGTSPDSNSGYTYYFTLLGQSEGSFVSYFLVAHDRYHAVYSDTFGIQIGGFSFAAYFESGDLIARLGEFIHNAAYSLDCCYYEIFNETIVDSLLAAHQRGVRIRIITDSTYYFRPGITALLNAGIPVIHEGMGPNSPLHIMHNKFIVRDYGDSDPSNDCVWTGSFNAGDYLHVDNSIIIRSTEVARAYALEFNQMWGSDSILPDTLISKTGTRKSDVLTNHVFVSGSDTVWVYFSPQDSSIQYLCSFASRARSSVAYLIYSFTRGDLRDTLISLHSRGILVAGVHEDNLGINPVFTDLQNAGIQVYWANISPPYNLLHAKVMLIDTTYIITGSMNWSNNGNDDNDENIVIIRNSTLVRLYWDWFNQHFEEASGYRLGVYEGKNFSELQAFPNPFKSVVKFSRTNLIIYDISGREVRRLENEQFWDGRDLEGRTVKPGIYIIKEDKGRNYIKILKIN